VATVPPLDELAAQLVSRAQLRHRAVHDAGPWAIRWAGQTAPAERVLDEERAEVRFYAWLAGGDTGPSAAELTCAGVSLSCREIEMPPVGRFRVEWVLELCESVAA
jgi:hypothetical protein